MAMGIELKVWLLIGTLLLVVMVPTFYIGRVWERDTYPRGDHHTNGPNPFAPPRPDLAERVKTARVQAQYERLVGGFGPPGNPGETLPPRDGLTVNQWWEQIMEQAGDRDEVDALPNGKGQEKL